MDIKPVPATNDLGAFVMAQERQRNASKLLGIPFEIREIIWGHLDEGPKISVLDLKGANENGLTWTTENVTREEYEDRFRPRTPVAINNVATSNATTNRRTMRPRLAIIAHVVPYVLTVAWIFCKEIANAVDGFIWFLTAISIVTTLEPLEVNLRQLVTRRQFSNLRNRLHRGCRRHGKDCFLAAESAAESKESRYSLRHRYFASYGQQIDPKGNQAGVPEKPFPCPERKGTARAMQKTSREGSPLPREYPVNHHTTNRRQQPRGNQELETNFPLNHSSSS